MAPLISFYFQVHQPYRLRDIRITEIGRDNLDYFDCEKNRAVFRKVAEKCYLPCNALLLTLLNTYPDFRVSFSLSGIFLDQCTEYGSDVLESFQKLAETGKVEFLAETYHHTLSCLWSLPEFCEQVARHVRKVEELFGQTPAIFRNTELVYSNELARIAEHLGFRGILAEGADHILAGRSPNYPYVPPDFELPEEMREVVKATRGQSPRACETLSGRCPSTRSARSGHPSPTRPQAAALRRRVKKWQRVGGEAYCDEKGNGVEGFSSQYAEPDRIHVLLKNYRLSDDVAFRFSDKSWVGFPLTAEQFTAWLTASGGHCVNLYMDYETFGEHQWEDTGIFEFLRTLPRLWQDQSIRCATPSGVLDAWGKQSLDTFDAHLPVSWADIERDLSAWRGNRIQEAAMAGLYALEGPVKESGDPKLLDLWRRLQTSDHFYYMCTKYWNDGDVHKYFSPYESPYEAYRRYSHALCDLKTRLEKIRK